MPRRLLILLALCLTPLAASAGERVVKRSDLGAEWPLTVESGTLSCRPFMSNLHILTIEANGRVWAVNGTAKGQGYADIEPIWASSPEISGARMSLGPLIELAKSLCS